MGCVRQILRKIFCGLSLGEEKRLLMREPCDKIRSFPGVFCLNAGMPVCHWCFDIREILVQ